MTARAEQVSHGSQKLMGRCHTVEHVQPHREAKGPFMEGKRQPVASPEVYAVYTVESSWELTAIVDNSEASARVRDNP